LARIAKSMSLDKDIIPTAFYPTSATNAFPWFNKSLVFYLVLFYIAIISAIKNSPNLSV
jgi:hypothetical protein